MKLKTKLKTKLTKTAFMLSISLFGVVGFAAGLVVPQPVLFDVYTRYIPQDFPQYSIFSVDVSASCPVWQSTGVPLSPENQGHNIFKYQQPCDGNASIAIHSIVASDTSIIADRASMLPGSPEPAGGELCNDTLAKFPVKPGVMNYTITPRLEPYSNGYNGYYVHCTVQ